LHQADRLATVLRGDDLPDQHGAHGPFPAEAEPLQGTEHEDLLEILREADRERADGEPEDCALQHLDPAVAVRQHARDPSANRGEDQRHGAQQPCLAPVQSPDVDQ